eukprot:m.130281 g.130281  ORF g.130281 m.130281 type:complete len:436 (-) comp13898_c1_seq1:308-1615(-)
MRKPPFLQASTNTSVHSRSNHHSMQVLVLLLATLVAVTRAGTFLNTVTVHDVDILSSMPPEGYKVHLNDEIEIACDEQSKYNLVSKEGYDSCDLTIEGHLLFRSIITCRPGYPGSTHIQAATDSQYSYFDENDPIKGFEIGKQYYLASVTGGNGSMPGRPSDPGRGGICLQGAKFTFSVVEDPVCDLACCPGSEGICMFSLSSPNQPGCQDYEYDGAGASCDDGLAETFNTKCNAFGACHGSMVLTLYVDTEVDSETLAKFGTLKADNVTVELLSSTRVSIINSINSTASLPLEALSSVQASLGSFLEISVQVEVWGRAHITQIRNALNGRHFLASGAVYRWYTEEPQATTASGSTAGLSSSQVIGLGAGLGTVVLVVVIVGVVVACRKSNSSPSAVKPSGSGAFTGDYAFDSKNVVQPMYTNPLAPATFDESVA